MKTQTVFVVCVIIFSLVPVQVSGQCPSADLTGDCFVDLADFAEFVNQWLTGIPKDLANIPAGTFQMGDTLGDGYSNELPVHTITLDAFYIGKTEITNSQYCAFLNSAYPSELQIVNGIVYSLNDSTYSYPYCAVSSSDSWNQIAFSNNVFSVLSKAGRDMSQYPMGRVTWHGAVAFCNWRSQQEGRELCYDLNTWNCDFIKKGYRLPTEAEWEYAARGSLEGKRFPWGNTITHGQANYNSSDSYFYDISPTRGYHPLWNDGIEPYTAPVGSLIQNGYGLFDMSGNAMEWCNDWFDENYYKISPTHNPTGPVSGDVRVMRGGVWRWGARHCRTSFRNNNPPYLWIAWFSPGFRIVLDLD